MKKLFFATIFIFSQLALAGQGHFQFKDGQDLFEGKYESKKEIFSLLNYEYDALKKSNCIQKSLLESSTAKILLALGASIETVEIQKFGASDVKVIATYSNMGDIGGVVQINCELKKRAIYVQ